MKTESKRTKQLKTGLFWVNAITFLVTTFPLIFAFIWGLADGNIYKGDKVFLGISFLSAAVIYIINIVTKHSLRSPMFIMLLGLYFVLDQINAILIIISIGTCLDEFILTPLKAKLKTQVIANKEIDLRE